MSKAIINEQVVRIDYTNHRGERGERRVFPVHWRFGSTSWHPQPQWLMLAIDVDRLEAGRSAPSCYREFAVKDIHSWAPDPVFNSVPLPGEMTVDPDVRTLEGYELGWPAIGGG